MANIGTPDRIIVIPEPIEAPVFTPPARRETTEVPDWLNPNKVKEPALVPVRRS